MISFSFDISLFECFLPLVLGGQVEILDKNEVMDIMLLNNYLKKK